MNTSEVTPVSLCHREHASRSFGADRYVLSGRLSDVSFTPAESILRNASFDSGLQNLHPLTGLRESTSRF